MNFTEYMHQWVKSEVTQGRIMILCGFVLVFVLYFITKSNHDLLKGFAYPMGILLIVLLGYGPYILYSRPQHGNKSIQLYETSREEAVSKEKEKHINDNKVGELAIKYVYATLMIVASILVLIIPGVHNKGIMLGILFLSVNMFIIDYSFVSRSQKFLAFLQELTK